MARKLTPLQERFVTEYLIDQNGTQAAIRAGSSATSARTMAARWLAKGTVKNELAVRKAELQRRNDIKAIDVRAELGQMIADGDLNTTNRLRALELYAKLTGQMVERSEVKQVTTTVTLSPTELSELRDASALMHSRRHGVLLPGDVASGDICRDNVATSTPTEKACFSGATPDPRKGPSTRDGERGAGTPISCEFSNQPISDMNSQ